MPHQIGDIGQAHTSHSQVGTERMPKTVQRRFSDARPPADSFQAVEQVGETLAILIGKYPLVAHSVFVLLQIREFLSPVKKVRVIEEILDKMRALVDSGKLAKGSKLPSERDLCAMLSVSRPSLREALKVLDILGVIKTRQGDGT